MKIIRLLTITALMAFIIITHTSCGDESPVSKSDFCLDTACEITIYNEMEKGEAEQILEEAFSLMRDYEQQLSRTISTSDIANINKAAGKSVEVDEDTMEVINIANTVSAESEGAFDITIGKITKLWDFKSGEGVLPNEGEIAAGLSHINYENIQIGDKTIAISDSEGEIDLGGVAKGYIADKVCAFLEENGVTSGIVNLGGNVVAIGEKEGGNPWNIGIERPFTDRKELIGTVQVKDATVVTSGIYERNFEVDGKIYHHILDPKTGYPAETDLEAVTIVAAKGQSGFCDAVSTACLILGKDGAIKLIEQIQQRYPEKCVEAAFIDNNGDIVQTDGMKITFSK